jgi:hypothetical protein
MQILLVFSYWDFVTSSNWSWKLKND